MEIYIHDMLLKLFLMIHIHENESIPRQTDINSHYKYLSSVSDTQISKAIVLNQKRWVWFGM